MPFLAPVAIAVGSAVAGKLATDALSGGSNAAGFKGQMPNIGQSNAVTDQANAGVQNSLESQQKLLGALQGQNGIQNQSQVYGQLQDVSQGKGPNPAQAMLNQTTGQNVASQGALQAGQRGASSNVGLMARQIGQQGAATQQNAAGQAATLQANQSLNALGAAGNMANTQAANQIGATQNLGAQQLTNQGQQLGALGSYNQSLTGGQSNVNTTGAQIAGANIGTNNALIGGALGGVGAAIGTMGKTNNPSAPAPGIAPAPAPMQTGANLGVNTQLPQPTPTGFAQGGIIEGPQSSVGRFLGGHKPMAYGGNVGSQLKSGGPVPGQAKVQGNSYQNDNVKALLSPGEVVIPRDVMQSKNPSEGAAKFVAAILAKKKGGK